MHTFFQLLILKGMYFPGDKFLSFPHRSNRSATYNILHLSKKFNYVGGLVNWRFQMEGDLCDICGGKLGDDGNCPACDNLLKIDSDDSFEKDIDETMKEL